MRNRLRKKKIKKLKKELRKLIKENEILKDEIKKYKKRIDELVAENMIKRLKLDPSMKMIPYNNLPKICDDDCYDKENSYNINIKYRNKSLLEW